MTGRRRWLSLLMVTMLAVVGAAVAAGADSGSEAEFLAKINASRAAAGLAPLQVDSGLQAHARKHTQDMINAGSIYHSSSGELQAAAGSGWTRVGENVGRGQSPSSLHDAFMNSAGHRANILGEYNYVGIGTGSSGGYLYVTVVFMQKGSSPPATTTTTAATTTTVPPSSSTTLPAAGGSTPASTTTTTTPAATTTTTVPPTTTTLVVPPDRAVTPGLSCLQASLYSQLCHD